MSKNKADRKTRSNPREAAPVKSAPKNPSVSIVMGSDSDWPIMQEATKALDLLEISYETSVVSAHRTPLEMIEYAQQARKRGVRVIIAGAGGAAHLPGMIAAVTELPVIGVPVPMGVREGEDALWSIVQMPKGVPVATVAIGQAWNAGILAGQILGAASTQADPEAILNRIRGYKDGLRAEVKAKRLK